MAFIDVKEQFKKKKKHAVNAVLFTDKAAQYAKSRMDKKNLGVFLGKKDAATLHLKFPPPFGMQVHGPAFLTQASHRNTVFPVWDTNKPASHC